MLHYPSSSLLSSPLLSSLLLLILSTSIFSLPHTPPMNHYYIPSPFLSTYFRPLSPPHPSKPHFFLHPSSYIIFTTPTPSYSSSLHPFTPHPSSSSPSHSSSLHPFIPHPSSSSSHLTPHLLHPHLLTRSPVAQLYSCPEGFPWLRPAPFLPFPPTVGYHQKTTLTVAPGTFPRSPGRMR